MEKSKDFSEELKGNILKSAEEMKTCISSFIDALTAIHAANIPSFTTLDSTDGLDSTESTASAMPDSEEETEETGHFEREDLESMTFNDLRKLAKDLGVSAKGGRDKVIDSILSASAIDDDIEEEKPSKSEKKPPVNKPAIPADEEDDVEDDDAEEDGVEEEIDEVVQSVLEIVNDMETSEIADILSDAGISPKGKRQALIDKVVKAVKDGIISITDTEEGETEEDIEEDGEELEDVIEDGDVDSQDEFGPNDFDNPEMTEQRLKALKSLDAQIRREFKSKKIKPLTMKKELKEFYADDDDALKAISAMKSDEILDNYIDMKQLFIDDDGNLVDRESPYTVNGEYYCCGTALTFNEDDGTFICEICGSEYDAE